MSEDRMPPPPPAPPRPTVGTDYDAVVALRALAEQAINGVTVQFMPVKGKHAPGVYIRMLSQTQQLSRTVTQAEVLCGKLPIVLAEMRDAWSQTGG